MYVIYLSIYLLQNIDVKRTFFTWKVGSQLSKSKCVSNHLNDVHEMCINKKLINETKLIST